MSSTPRGFAAGPCLALLCACTGASHVPPPPIEQFTFSPATTSTPAPHSAGGLRKGQIHKAAPLGNSRIQFSAPNADGSVDRVIATDPDHDSVWIAFLDGAPPQQIELATGSEPGDIQLATDPSTGGTTAFVSVHNSGDILAIPMSRPSAAPVSYSTLRVCTSPRGMDFVAGSLYVACADGSLVTLHLTGSRGISSLSLPDDLKDVVVVGGSTAIVTRFRTAEVLQVQLTTGQFTTFSLPSFTPSGGASSTMVADVAWQMIPFGAHEGALIAHQLASTDVIAVNGVDAGPGPTGCQTDQQGYGPPPPGCSRQVTCPTGVVAVAATQVLVDATGRLEFQPLAVFPQLVSPLTIAIAGESAVISGLGNATTAGVLISPGSAPAQSTTFACISSDDMLRAGTAAVGYSPADDGSALRTVLTLQNPAYEQGPQIQVVPGAIAGMMVTLPYSSISGEEGRNLFHQATPSMTSCASCHPNGRDDSHIWNFDPMGLRRTPALGGGLLATAPFHWDGSELDISQLMTDVFVGRMEGSPPSADEVTAISQWIDGLPEARAAAAPPERGAARGKVLFESPGVGCSNCHSGPHFTNNATMDVGTGGAFQVPSLLGVGSRPPYLHDGRAATLADRFDPTLGGADQHGHTSQLTAAQIQNLVLYLRSL